MKHRIIPLILLIFVTSCIDKDVYEGHKDDIPKPVYVSYLYPYGSEVKNAVAEITLETESELDASQIEAVIPPLKYNKSWLFMLTQDDCQHAAYSTTWAAINGKPLSNSYYYNAEQLAAGDLPPDHFYLGKTLGSTDGAGNEVRFAFTTTVAPEWEWMDAETSVDFGFSENYYRFFMKSGLTWNNLAEMLAYGTAIAFHDVNTKSVHREDSILKHYEISQQIILNKLAGRGCKTLAEPNGNKSYVNAAVNYSPIEIMTAQNTGAPGSTTIDLVTLYPFKVETDLHKSLLKRYFFDTSYEIVSRIESEVRKEKEEREAIHIGVHGTYVSFAEFLRWLNNRYGKDGDDSVWFPSLEEFYEYNYYRMHSDMVTEISGNMIKLQITLPSQQFFYYPSVTVNLSGIHKVQISSVYSNDQVTGLSYADYGEGIMLNIDCRKYLAQHATHFVEKYEGYKSKSNYNDALYFINMLKESNLKSKLLQRVH